MVRALSAPRASSEATAPGSAASAVRRSRIGRTNSTRASARSRLQVAVALVGAGHLGRGDRSVATASSSIRLDRPGLASGS